MNNFAFEICSNRLECAGLTVVLLAPFIIAGFVVAALLLVLYKAYMKNRGSSGAAYSSYIVLVLLSALLVFVMARLFD